MRKPSFFLFLVPLIFSTTSFAAPESPFHFESKNEQSTLVEFFTSENLKSCNAAESWFSGFKDSPDLFTKIIPVSYHLDKWDDRTWKDGLAVPDSKERFLGYSHFWHTSNLYVPVIAVDGVEWSGWSHEQAIPPSLQKVGVLSVDGSINGEFVASFKAVDDTISDWTVHAALMGCEMPSEVKRGQNTGTFTHEFVAFAHQSQLMRRPYGTDWKATLKLKIPPGIGPKRRAVAVWISHGDSPLPLQAAGAYYPQVSAPKKIAPKPTESSIDII